MRFRITSSIAPRLFSPKRAFCIFIEGCILTFLIGTCYSQQAKPVNAAPVKPVADFQDVAEKPGLTMQEIFGGIASKKYIIETTCTDLASYDNNNYGWPT